jgi:GNAT superfamily N-acetyltransferase
MDKWLHAMHANMLRAVLRIGHLTEGSAAERVGPWLLIDAGVGMPRFNQALVVEEPENPGKAVADALTWFEDRGIEGTFLLREPFDSEVARVLRGEGFEAVESGPAMLLQPLPKTASATPGLTIREVHSEADIFRYAEVDSPAWHTVTLGIARTALEFPDFVMLLGEVDGEKAATSMAVMTGDLAGVYNVQVRPEFRGRGFGRAMTAAAITVGHEAGCVAASLQSTPMGLPLYTNMGFETKYRIDVWARPGTLD